MSPDFVAVYTHATEAEALERGGHRAALSDAHAWILRGEVSLADLAPVEPETPSPT